MEKPSLGAVLRMPQTYVAILFFTMYTVGWNRLVDGWASDPMTHGPWVIQDVSIIPPLVASVVYLVVVWLGVHVMRGVEQPFRLGGIMVVYNFYQTLFNSWFLVRIIGQVIEQGMNVWGNSYSSESRFFFLAVLIWLHYQNKYLELMDTMFMILRKKENQLTFLHLYHHVSIIWAWWLVSRFSPASDAYFGAMMNSFIHIVMYSYYTLALMDYRVPWKPYLTMMQMTQFLICLLQALYIIYINSVPRWLASVQVWVMVSLMYLFRRFYAITYSTSSKKKKVA